MSALNYYYVTEVTQRLHLLFRIGLSLFEYCFNLYETFMVEESEAQLG